MESIKRKRVTRVGSGAFSIYLPKKWIDAWLPQQQEHREVDLHRINDSLLIVPAIQDRSLRVTSRDDAETVQDQLVSAYVRGYRHVGLTPAEGRFCTETQIRARDVLRHTDERLVQSVGPDAIGFHLDGRLPAPFQSGSDLIGVLGVKVREVVDLAGEALASYGHDPERALHAMQMMRSIHDDDVARLWHQALRLVATVELPLETVSDFQLLDLTAAELQTVSSQCVQLAAIMLEEWGLGLRRLDYPRNHLIKELRDPGPMPSIGKGMVRAYTQAIQDVPEAISRLLSSIAAADAAALRGQAKHCRQAQAALQDRLFQNALEHWGQRSDDGGARTFTASRLAQPLGHVLESLARIGERAVILLAAKPEAGPARRNGGDGRG